MGYRGIGHMGNGGTGGMGYGPNGQWAQGAMGTGGIISQVSKRCQVVKKMSNVKKSNTWTMEEVQKKIN